MTGFQGRYLFVGGLHRTGTSLVGRLIAAHPSVRAITRSPAPENEGCYLQGAIPHTAQHGRPIHFATDPAQHHIEGSPFDRLETRQRMEADWAGWFAPGGDWRVEKSPVNMTRMRLYQQLFPMAQFVVMLRHPEAMAAALAKWSDAPAAAIIDHALDAYARMADDLAYLHAAMLLRYEDLVAAPDAMTARLHHFMGLEAQGADMAMRDGNADYADAVPMTAAQAERAALWGYGPDLEVLPYKAHIGHPLRTIRDAVG